jgi:hypothetical protein
MMTPYLILSECYTLFNWLGIAVFIVAVMTRASSDRMSAAAAPTMGPHLNTSAIRPARWRRREIYGH